ncbi:MAG: hypothetical protein IJO60_03500 [Agathobacter sp.]|nr:hypothetical protein [Agathobacter sp.]
MENLGFYAMYVVEGIFVLLLLFGGVFPYKFPMKYQMALDYLVPDGKYFGTFLRYPHYSSKRALSSKENWELAQKTYGMWLVLFAGVQTIIGVFWYPIAEFAMGVTKWDDAGMAVVTCPIIVFIILANVFTEIKLRKM